ncbi:MAG: DUF835 domain-containing protein [Thermoplasmata archaeon]|jgi:hypothetical protein|nr:DUF835 domain-containing protein [Euryarchaeota archaeon]
MEDKSELIIALFKEMIGELKSKLNEDEINRDEIYSLLRTYEKKLGQITKPRMDKKPDLLLNFGESYMVDEEKPSMGFFIFKQALDRGRGGICITRSHPESISFYKSAENVKFIWLTSVTYMSGRVSSIQPNELSLITNAINSFLREGQKGIVLFDGIELLITNNGFDNIAKSLTTIKDNIRINKGIMIISINLKTLKEEEKNFLLREFNLIQVPART